MAAAREAAERERVHATAIAFPGLAGAGVLIRGPSGSGKSDLALRCMALAAGPPGPGPAGLVADDRVEIWRTGAHIMMTAPAAIAGQLEVRGVGIVDVVPAGEARLVLVADLVASPAAVERMPEGDLIELFGVAVARVVVYPFEPSAALKLALAARIAAATVA